jgi:HPt (histidine-containing phosphotransfer) domain-containing protein
MIMQASRAFNPDRLNGLLGGKPEDTADVLKIACDTLPRIARRLCESGLSATDARSLAHQLKGASLSAGAEELAGIAAALEEELEGPWTRQARVLVGSMQLASRRFLAASTAYLKVQSVR